MSANASPQAAPIWQARIATRRIYRRRLVECPDGETKVVSIPLNLYYVVLQRRENERVSFCVTRPKGRLVFSDKRECSTGTAGSTGLWGTRPPSKAGKNRTLTPTAWREEVRRFIGEERAEEIIGLLSGGRPLPATRDEGKRRPPPPAGSSEEAAETAMVVGYRVGLGSQVQRAE